jgi:hypothetical protein
MRPPHKVQARHLQSGAATGAETRTLAEHIRAASKPDRERVKAEEAQQAAAERDRAASASNANLSGSAAWRSALGRSSR